MSGGRIPLPYPGSQAELNSEPLGLRGVGLACSEEWPCFWHSLAPPLSRQLEGLDVAPAAGAVAMAAAAAAVAINEARAQHPLVRDRREQSRLAVSGLFYDMVDHRVIKINYESKLVNNVSAR
jgi:hypothetical protein